MLPAILLYKNVACSRLFNDVCLSDKHGILPIGDVAFVEPGHLTWY